MPANATGYYVILHYRTGEVRAGGPFISQNIAQGYADAKEAANGQCQAVITGPIPATEPAKFDLLARLRAFAGL